MPINKRWRVWYVIVDVHLLFVMGTSSLTSRRDMNIISHHARGTNVIEEPMTTREHVNINELI